MEGGCEYEVKRNANAVYFLRWESFLSEQPALGAFGFLVLGVLAGFRTQPAPFRSLLDLSPAFCIMKLERTWMARPACTHKPIGLRLLFRQLAGLEPVRESTLTLDALLVARDGIFAAASWFQPSTEFALLRRLTKEYPLLVQSEVHAIEVPIAFSVSLERRLAFLAQHPPLKRSELQ